MKINYSRLPKDVKEAIEPIPYVVEEAVKLTWDGRQFILRIPKEIAEEAGITVEKRISFKFVKPSPESAEKPKLEITVL
jgi:thiamine pyrophosphate-dependent acetolactate synthase large subunit-like protein